MKASVRWLLFEYNGLELVIVSKPFKTKKLAEKAARKKYPDRMRRKSVPRRMTKPIAVILTQHVVWAFTLLRST